MDREVDAFFLSLGYKHNREKKCFEIVKKNPKRVALFAHQGFGLLFLSSVLDIPYPIFSTSFDFSHSSVTVVDFGRANEKIVCPKILQLSNDSHLYKEGLLTGYENGIRV
jgi:broad specificity phosphatase PhoE